MICVSNVIDTSTAKRQHLYLQMLQNPPQFLPKTHTASPVYYETIHRKLSKAAGDCRCLILQVSSFLVCYAALLINEG